MTRQGQQLFNNLGASSPTSCLGGFEIGDAPSYIKGAGENKMKTRDEILDQFCTETGMSRERLDMLNPAVEPCLCGCGESVVKITMPATKASE